MWVWSSMPQVFLDEVNTSSCLGLFKEIIVDRTFDGEVCGAAPGPSGGCD